MLKNKAAVSILLFFICSNSCNYGMECTEEDCMDESSIEDWNLPESKEEEKPEPSPQYLINAHSNLILSIQNRDLEGFVATIEDLRQNLISKEIEGVLISEDKKSEQRPLDLAESLPEDATKRFILNKLKSNGVPRLMDDNEFQANLENLDSRFLLRHEQLMKSIESGNIENVKKVLAYAYDEWGGILYSSSDVLRQNPVKNNFQIILLLNEPDRTNGHTPLTLAIENGLVDIANFLITQGANHRTKNKNGYKPEDIAKVKLGTSKEEFYKMFNIKKTITEISEEYVESAEHKELVAKIERKISKKKAKHLRFPILHCLALLPDERELTLLHEANTRELLSKLNNFQN